MIKRTMAVLMGGLLVTQAQAEKQHEGFYVGGNLGLSNTQGKYSALTVNNTGGTVSTKYQLGQNHEFSNLSPQFGIFGGYGVMVDQFYIGGEVFGGLDTASVVVFDGLSTPDQNVNNDNGTWGYLDKVTLKRTYFFGLSARLGGYQPTDIALCPHRCRRGQVAYEV